MKKLILLLLLTSCSTMKPDKQLHSIAGFGIGFTSYHVYYQKEKDNRLGSVLLSIGTSLVIGTLKEIADNQKGGTGFNVADLTHTGVSGVIGSISMDLLSNRKRKRLKK